MEARPSLAPSMDVPNGVVRQFFDSTAQNVAPTPGLTPPTLGQPFRLIALNAPPI